MLYYETIAPKTLELLIQLQSLNALKETRLVGGTSLSLQYGHRISVDLDLFGYQMDVDFIDIIGEIKDFGLDINIRKQSPKMLIALIEQVKVDIVNYPYKWIDTAITEDKLLLASEKDIAAMKISAITNRGTKKDFYDLYFLIKRFSLENILSLYSEKYGHDSTFMALKSLNYFDDAEKEADPIVLNPNVTWNEVKSVISKELKQLI